MSLISIRENFLRIKKQIPDAVDLVAVSKTHPAEEILEVYKEGQRVFGENKVQELAQKYPALPKDIQWHLIGHLQRNKVKYIAPFVDTIQSVDSEKLLKEIDKEARKNNRTIKILLQIKIAEEDAKTGLTQEEAQEIFGKILSGAYPNISIEGLMGMATFTVDEAQLRREFGTLKDFFDQLSQRKKMKTLSMGMSGDFPLAIACGSTSVRIGTAIFGHRNYS